MMPRSPDFPHLIYPKGQPTPPTIYKWTKWRKNLGKSANILQTDKGRVQK